MWCDLSLNWGLLGGDLLVSLFHSYFSSIFLNNNNILGSRRKEDEWEGKNEKCNASSCN